MHTHDLPDVEIAALRALEGSSQRILRFDDHAEWGFSTASLGVSVVETQLGYLELVAFNSIHHAVLIRDPA